MGDHAAGGRRGVGGVTVALMVAGMVFTFLAAVSLWSWRTFATSDGFADVTSDMLREPAVAEVVADQIVSALEDNRALAQASATARPLLREIVKDIVTTDAFRGLFRAGARELHAAVVGGHRTRMQVEVNDTPQLVKETLQIVNPALAAQIPDEALTVVVGLSQNKRADLAMRGADLAGWLIIPLTALAACCFVVAVRLSGDRRRALQLVGLSVLVVGVVIFTLLAALIVVVADVGQDPRERTALRAVFWSLMHVLNVTGKLLMVVGASLALAASIAGAESLESRLRSVAEAGRILLARPVTKALTAAVAIGIGLVGLVWPIATGQLMVRVAAVGLFTVGAVWIFDLLGASAWVAGAGDALHTSARRFATTLLVTLAVVALLLTLGGMSFVRALRPSRLERANIHSTGCNGREDLCDRPIDEVVFAATHNSMAASTSGFLGARQVPGLGAQLAAGVRGFLIDLHYGGRDLELVRTDVVAEAALGPSYADVGPLELAALDKAFASVRATRLPEERSVYLCHVYCELGATSAKTAFQMFGDWLKVNQNEVVILVLEDHVSAEDAVKVLRASGLAKRAYAWEPDEPAPTLRQLIDSDKNVIILVENRGGTVPSAPWYMSAYESVLQDTPFQFSSETEIADRAACQRLRGEPAAPLFLLNHWLDTGLPDPIRAHEANRAMLESRFSRCERMRRRIENIVAVDFFTPDVAEFVNRLNGPKPASGVLATGS